MDSQRLKKWKKELSGEWKWEENSITIAFTFKTFRENAAFIQDLLQLADQQQHHPEVYTSYTYTRIVLTTHDVGGITEKDISMAKAINNILK